MNDWRILNTYVYPHEAHMAKSYLEFQGIEVILQDELTAQVNNFYSNAIGGVKILIREAEYNYGVEVLKQGGYVIPKDEHIEKKTESILLTSKTDKNKCPYCKSENIGRKKEPNILTLIVYFILGVLTPIFKRSFICFDCSKEWKFIKEN